MVHSGYRIRTSNRATVAARRADTDRHLYDLVFPCANSVAELRASLSPALWSQPPIVTVADLRLFLWTSPPGGIIVHANKDFAAAFFLKLRRFNCVSVSVRPDALACVEMVDDYLRANLTASIRVWCRPSTRRLRGLVYLDPIVSR